MKVRIKYDVTTSVVRGLGWVMPGSMWFKVGSRSGEGLELGVRR